MFNLYLLFLLFGLKWEGPKYKKLTLLCTNQHLATFRMWWQLLRCLVTVSQNLIKPQPYSPGEEHLLSSTINNISKDVYNLDYFSCNCECFMLSRKKIVLKVSFQGLWVLIPILTKEMDKFLAVCHIVKFTEMNSLCCAFTMQLHLQLRYCWLHATHLTGALNCALPQPPSLSHHTHTHIQPPTTSNTHCHVHRTTGAVSWGHVAAVSERDNMHHLWAGWFLQEANMY